MKTNSFEGFQHGVNLGGWLSQCDHSKERHDTFIGEDDIRTIASWGADHVRVPVDYELIEKNEGEYLEEGFAYIDRCIGWCRAAGLRMVLDLHKAAGYSFDEQINNGSGKADAFFESEALTSRFIALWKTMATRYRGETDMMAFELLNEIVDSSGGGRWNALSKRAFDVVRGIAQDAWIIIGSNNWNSIDALPQLPKAYDSRTVYTFHCYEPMWFTHQFAYWMDSSAQETVHYPDTRAAYRAAGSDRMIGAFSGYDGEAADSAFLESVIRRAVESCADLGSPLYCGEYGVIDRAPLPDTLRWYQDFHALFERYSIGRAAWSYKQMDFGLVDDHYAPIRPQLLACL